ncbi:MAG TPA: pilus assembly protein TadG-related protein [Vicinamibacterales bacterium]|nr:pilus assembly protein TadG-related protein [Vicinamibacterales bacterium]
MRLNHLARDERGMSIVFVGVSFLAFMSATTLAIDVGMFMTARSQAQNAADAGALAGATALVFNSYTDRSAGGPAVQGAINASRANQVMAAAPSVVPADVTFPNDPSGQPNRVQVQVYRTTARSNAVPTLIGAIFGVPTVNINAVAVGEASPANAETCVKPFTIPDKWKEVQTPPWTPNSTFDMYDSKGNPLANPDVYIGPSDPANYTGYNPIRDKGLEVTLKANNSTKITASFYNPWDLPGSVGASDYRNNIANCNTARFGIGQNMPPENGNMVGPTAQGTDDLIAKDPNAYWDSGCNCVKGSAYGVSPRVVVIPVYDPVAFANGAQSGKNITLTVTNYIGVFMEDMKGNQVYGRITPVLGIYDANAGPAPEGAFPRVIRLVQ